MSTRLDSPGTVVDCTALSTTFPPPIADEVPRDAIVNLLDDLFDHSFQLVTLDGRPDIGKTRIVAQFARMHCNDSFSVFVRPNSALLLEPQLLFADLAAQMSWALNQRELADLRFANEAVIRNLSFDLQRVAKKTGRHFHFVIDGLGELSDSPGQFTAALVSILPFEFSGFRFLLTDDGSWIPSETLRKLNNKQLTVAGFSLDETMSYFSGYELDRGDIEEIYRSCSRGTPGYLASVRRCLDAGFPAAKLVEELHKNVSTPFRFEWQTVDQQDGALLDALAILAHDSKPHSIAELGALTNTSAADLRQRLERCRFLELSAANNEGTSYVSHSFRAFAADQLASRKSEVWEKLVSY